MLKFTSNEIYKKLTMCAAILMGLSSCNPGAIQKNKESVSHLDFNPTSGNYTGLASKLKQPKLTACISGITSSSQLEWQTKIQASILAWVDVLRPQTTDKLVEVVDVVMNGSNCDTTIVATSGAWAMTQMNENPRVNLATEGYFASFNVVLHEFGHAFGLYDTYMNGQSGNCQPGQPQAVMCNTSFKELQADDIAGVKTIFKRAFPNDTPNTNQDVSSNEPKIKMRLKETLSIESQQIDFAVDSSKSGSLSFCMDSRDNCVKVNKWQEISAGGVNQNTNSSIKFFTSVLNSGITDGKNLTARFLDASGVPSFQTIKFKSALQSEN